MGKIKSKFFLARYNVELDEWEKLKEAKIEARFMYLTLMSMFKGRFIAIIGMMKPLIYDVVMQDWVVIDYVPGSHPVVPRSYPGVLQLPYKYHR